MTRFIRLTQTTGDVCYINVDEIRGIFPRSLNAVLNIGTAANLTVIESAETVLEMTKITLVD